MLSGSYVKKNVHRLHTPTSTLKEKARLPSWANQPVLYYGVAGGREELEKPTYTEMKLSLWKDGKLPGEEMIQEVGMREAREKSKGGRTKIDTS